MRSRRAVTTLATLVALTSFCAAHLAAQQTAPPAPRIPVLAGALEWLTIPTLGYAYAGDWSRGIPSALVRLTGFGLAVSAIEDENGEDRAVLGLVLFLGASAFAVVDAANTASRENRRRIATQSSLSMTPDFEDGRFGVRVRVALGR